MLTRLRRDTERAFQTMVMMLRLHKVHPALLTLSGLALALGALAVALDSKTRPLMPVLIALSALMDALDGVVARVGGRATAFGSVLDSFCDRVEDFLYLLALFLAGAHYMVVVASIATSFLVSYVRALGNAHGIRLEGVGLAERGERAILVLASSLLLVVVGKYAEVPLYLLTVLSCVTVIQRLIYLRRALR